MANNITLQNVTGQIVTDINGVTYFKLVSDYPGDYTKNCGLTSAEIDGNFYFLRGMDIESVKLDEHRNLILERFNGDKLTVSVSQEIGQPTFEYNTETGILTVNYPNGTQDFIEGFLIPDEVFAMVDEYLQTSLKVATDYTLKGDGRILNPLSISETERTGTYAPALYFYDMTQDEFATLPTENLYKGYRIVTKEIFSKFGKLYNYDGVQELKRQLENINSLWRIPTRKDWADLLNSAEYCEEDRNHDTFEINTWTGKDAGARAKSANSWQPSEAEEQGLPVAGEDNLPCTGSQQTFHVVPIGYGQGSRGVYDYDSFDDYDIEGAKYTASFWTDTETGSKHTSARPNVFTRTFAYNTRKVKQESSNPSSRLSIRLVRDFDYAHLDYNEYENILGHMVPCVLITNPETNYSQIWTSVNIGFAEPIYSGVSDDEAWEQLEEAKTMKGVYFINEWNGKQWIKKQMNPGDSVVILDYDNESGTTDDRYHEWRVYEKEDGNYELRDTLEMFIDEFNHRFEELNEKIDNEIERATNAENEIASALTEEVANREQGDAELWSALTQEIADREQGDAELWSGLTEEVARATEEEQKLWSALTQEIADRKQGDDELWSGLTEEIERATNAENEIMSALTQEIERATNAENEIMSALTQEVADRKQGDAELWSGLTEEIARATEAEEQIMSALTQEITRATDAENEIMSALTEEVARATEAEEQIMSALTEEIERAVEEDEKLWSALTQEIADREQADDVIVSALTEEIERATEAESNLYDNDISGSTIFSAISGLTLYRNNGETIIIKTDNDFGVLPPFSF